MRNQENTSTIKTEEGSPVLSVASDISNAGGVICTQLGTAFHVVGAIFTESVRMAMGAEREYSGYECCRDSGVLSFWDDWREDIYTSEDGQQI